MSIVALGTRARVAGFRLAGAEAVPVEDEDAVVAAWERLPDDLELLVLTPEAAQVLDDRLGERPHLLWVVLP